MPIVRYPRQNSKCTEKACKEQSKETSPRLKAIHGFVISAFIIGVIIRFSLVQYDLKLKLCKYVLLGRAQRKPFLDEESGRHHAYCVRPFSRSTSECRRDLIEPIQYHMPKA